MEEIDLSEISGDMFYVKAEYKDQFLATVEKARHDWSGTNVWNKYPIFLRYRKCDFSGEEIQLEDQVYCLYVLKLKCPVSSVV